MPRHVEGRRVGSIDEIKEPGDYFVKHTEAGEIEALWFAMPGFPTHMWSRIGGQASSDKIRWEITEDSEGKVTVDPSIRSQWLWGEDKKQCLFHAYLKAGVWEILDDTIGAEFSG